MGLQTWRQYFDPREVLYLVLVLLLLLLFLCDILFHAGSERGDPAAVAVELTAHNQLLSHIEECDMCRRRKEIGEVVVFVVASTKVLDDNAMLHLEILCYPNCVRRCASHDRS